MPTQILKVNEDHANERLDVFLTQHLPDVPSRTFIKKLIETGQVKVNQTLVKAHYKVAVGDEVVVNFSLSEVPDSSVKPEAIDLDIFYEDDYLIVINKPVGLLVHPASGQYSGTLVNALLYHSRKLSDVNSQLRPGIVHRLDRETSGLIVVAKDNKTHVQLAEQFEERLVHKRYAALVEGSIEFDEGKIDVPLGRHPRYREKKSVQFSKMAKDAVTIYRVIKRISKITLVALYPQTGRTHQLRVHMAYLGHPILGDDKYGKESSFPRLALHAQSLGFTHPKTGCFLEFTTLLPEAFQQALKEEK